MRRFQCDDFSLLSHVSNKTLITAKYPVKETVFLTTKNIIRQKQKRRERKSFVRRLTGLTNDATVCHQSASLLSMVGDRIQILGKKHEKTLQKNRHLAFLHDIKCIHMNYYANAQKCPVLLDTR